LIVNVSVALPVPHALVALMITLYVPAVVGVPEITPFASVYEDVVFRLPVELRRAETPAA